MTPTCEHCGAQLDPRRSTKRFCDASCRARAWRNGTLTDDTTFGVNSDALEELLEGADGANPALVQAARSLASLVDSNPTATGLWARYLGALERLSDTIQDANDTELAELLAELQMPPASGS